MISPALGQDKLREKEEQQQHPDDPLTSEVRASIALSSEAVATTLFFMAWNGSLDVKRLSVERQILVPRPYRDVVPGPVKELQRVIQRLVVSTPDMFSEDKGPFSSIEWVESIALQDPCVRFSYSDGVGDIDCNKKMADAFFSATELCQMARTWHISPFQAIALFMAPESVPDFFECITTVLFSGGLREREDGVGTKLKLRDGGSYVPCEVIIRAWANLDDCGVIRAHSIRAKAKGTFILQFRELPLHVMTD